MSTQPTNASSASSSTPSARKNRGFRLLRIAFIILSVFLVLVFGLGPVYVPDPEIEGFLKERPMLVRQEDDSYLSTECRRVREAAERKARELGIADAMVYEGLVDVWLYKHRYGRVYDITLHDTDLDAGWIRGKVKRTDDGGHSIEWFSWGLPTDFDLDLVEDAVHAAGRVIVRWSVRIPVIVLWVALGACLGGRAWRRSVASRGSVA
ncbi:MAG TPA: hypothetical protein VNA25_13445 [Phycisphaerae bacterium]|nr:hypothetical protein [Phycisphaerae bacterium]HUT58845.1 hypothetical protein [Phycisphaerae bacterium]